MLDGGAISDSSQRFQDINADQHIHQPPELPAKSIIISKLRPVSQFCACDQANCRHSAHLRMLKYVKMPTPFRASKLLPFALHFACKVRYVPLLRL